MRSYSLREQLLFANYSDLLFKKLTLHLPRVLVSEETAKDFQEEQLLPEGILPLRCILALQ